MKNISSTILCTYVVVLGIYQNVVCLLNGVPPYLISRFEFSRKSTCIYVCIGVRWELMIGLYTILLYKRKKNNTILIMIRHNTFKSCCCRLSQNITTVHYQFIIV